MPYNSQIDRTDAGALIPEEVSREIIKNVPSKSMVMQLGRKLPNMSRKQRRIPVLSSLITAGWVSGDTGLKTTSDTSWDNVYINAEELAVIVPVPDAVRDDVDYDIWAEIAPEIEAAMGRAFDKAVLVGTNAPTDFPDDIMTQVVAASHTVDHSSVSGDYYDELLGEVGTQALIEADGYIPTGHIAPVAFAAKLRGLRDGSGAGQPIFMRSTDNGQNLQNATRYDLDGVPVLFDRDGILDPSVVLDIVGDWSQLVWAVRQDMTFKMLTEAVLQDESGNIVVNLAQQDMTALRVVMRLGWALPNPIKAANTNSATRLPFAALVP